MGLGISSQQGGAENSDFLSEVMGQSAGTQANTSSVLGNIGAFGGGRFGRGEVAGLSGALGLGNNVRGILTGGDVSTQLSSQDNPFFDRQGNTLGQGSIRGRSGRRGFEIQTPGSVNNTPNYYSTDYNPAVSGGKSPFPDYYNYGGNQNTLNFNYDTADTAGGNTLAQAGYVGGRINGPGGVSIDSRYGNSQDFSTSGSMSSPSQSGMTYGRNAFSASGSLASPGDFRYDNTFRQNVTGEARTASSTGANTGGEQGGGLAGMYYEKPQQIGQAVLSAGLGMIPVVGQVAGMFTQPIATALFGGPTVVKRDFARAQVNAQQDLGASAGLNSAGSFNLGRNAGAGGYAEAISPMFGNQAAAQADVNTAQQAQIGLSGDNIAANLGLDSNQNAAGGSFLQQTNTARKGGLLMPGMNKNAFTPGGYQGITQNSGAQLGITGQNDNSIGSGNINQQSDASVTTQQDAQGRGFRGFYNPTQTQTAQSQEGISGNISGQANLKGAAQNNLDLYNSAIGQVGAQKTEARAASQAQLEASLKAAGAKIDSWSQAKQILQGDVNNEVTNKALIQAQRFTDNIAQKFPNSPEAEQIINFIKQDPANAWLFDGNNSPDVILKAMANSVTNTNGGYQAESGNYYGEGNYSNLTRNDVNANISIDPNANNSVQRYKEYDPTPNQPNSGDEKVFANVGGQVREVPKGQLADINFNDQFNLGATSAANNASASIGAQGNVRGAQYYFANGQDQVYNTLANEIVGRANNTFNSEGVQFVKDLKTVNSSMASTQKALEDAKKAFGTQAQMIPDPSYKAAYGGWAKLDPSLPNGGVFSATQPIIENPLLTKVKQLEGSVATYSTQQGDLVNKVNQNKTQNITTNSDPYIQQIQQLKTKNLSAEDKAYLNQLIDQRTTELNSGYEQKQQSARQLSSQLDSAFENYINLKNTPAGNIANPEQFQAQLAAAEQNMNALAEQVKSAGADLQSSRPSGSVGYNDVKDRFLTGRDASKYNAEGYDVAGNAMMNGRSVADYQNLLDALQKQRDFDSQYDFAQGGNYVNISNVAAIANAKADATINMTNIPGRSNIYQSREASGGISPATGMYSETGDPTLQGRMNLTGYDPNMIGQNLYGPVNLGLSSVGVSQYFDPIRYHNDSRLSRLTDNRLQAAHSANQAIANGDIYRTS